MYTLKLSKTKYDFHKIKNSKQNNSIKYDFKYLSINFILTSYSIYLCVCAIP